MKMSANASESGKLTAEKLRGMLDGIPGEAEVTVLTDSNQLDGDKWSVSMAWDSSDDAGYVPRPNRLHRRAPRVGEGDYGMFGEH